MKNKSGGGEGRCLKETEALVGVLPPGGILNWNAQNNQSHSHRTDVEKRSHWLPGDNISFIRGDHSCVSDTSALYRLYFIDMLMEFCGPEWSHYLCTTVEQLWHHYPVNLLPTANWDAPPTAFVRPRSSVCWASRNPEAKTLPRVSARYRKYIVLRAAVREQLSAAERGFWWKMPSTLSHTHQQAFKYVLLDSFRRK